MSAESDAVDANIADVATQPKKVAGDMGSLEEFSVAELIEAAKYLKNKNALATTGGWRINRIIAPGADV